MRLGRLFDRKRDDKPQSIPIIKLRHFPKAGQAQFWTETLADLTCCIFPNVVVSGA